jgi:hypothetical protein
MAILSVGQHQEVMPGEAATPPGAPHLTTIKISKMRSRLNTISIALSFLRIVL